ncbi:DUF2061 domain-containing protein [Neisseriaceae bacterium B1]
MLKTLTFAILHFSVAFTITYLLTGSIGISSSVALIEPLANTVVFYFHEKAWKRFEQKSSSAPQPYRSCAHMPTLQLWHKLKHR